MASKKPVRGRHYLMRLSTAGTILDGPKDGFFTCICRDDGSPLILDEGFRGNLPKEVELDIEEWKELPEPDDGE
jgi:hypothetical protein